MSKKAIILLAIFGGIVLVAKAAAKNMQKTLDERQKELQTIVAGTRGSL